MVEIRDLKRVHIDGVDVTAGAHRVCDPSAEYGLLPGNSVMTPEGRRERVPLRVGTNITADGRRLGTHSPWTVAPYKMFAGTKPAHIPAGGMRPGMWCEGDGVVRTENGGRALMQGEREEFVICYETIDLKTRFNGGPMDTRADSNWLLNDARRHGDFRPLYRIRIIRRAPAIEYDARPTLGDLMRKLNTGRPKRDLWVRTVLEGRFASYDVMDGSEVVDGGFEYRSSAEDRMREIEEGMQ